MKYDFYIIEGQKMQYFQVLREFHYSLLLLIVEIACFLRTF